MVNIITDSTADLGRALTEHNQILTIPLYVNLGEKTYRDGVDISLTELFHSVAQTGELPKTSSPTVADFQAAFDTPGESVYITLSSQLSATYQNAVVAQQSYPPGKVFVIDSGNISNGIGLLALKAVDLRDQGLPAAEIARQVRGLAPKVRTFFVLETLEYLRKGGRCSAVESLVGGLLHIRPIITTRPDGSLGVKAKTRGTRQKALHAILDGFCEDEPQIDLQRVFVSHAGCEEDAVYLKKALLNLAPSIQDVQITTAGCVIASHCGPGTIAIFYMLK